MDTRHPHAASHGVGGPYQRYIGMSRPTTDPVLVLIENTWSMQYIWLKMTPHCHKFYVFGFAGPMLSFLSLMTVRANSIDGQLDCRRKSLFKCFPGEHVGAVNAIHIFYKSLLEILYCTGSPIPRILGRQLLGAHATRRKPKSSYFDASALGFHWRGARAESVLGRRAHEHNALRRRVCVIGSFLIYIHFRSCIPFQLLQWRSSFSF